MKSSKLVELEAIRGIASITVVLHHFCLAFAGSVKSPFPDGLGHTPFYWLVDGSGAVELFFLLSGFVLTRRYFDSGTCGAEVAMAAAKRLPRLLVPAGASILLSWAVLALGLGWHVEAGRISHSNWLLTYANAGFPPDFVPPLWVAFKQCLTVFFDKSFAGFLNTNLWTMRPEFVGSLLCFALVWLLHALRVQKPMQVALAATALAFLAFSLSTLALPFIMGTLLARFLRVGQIDLSRRAGGVLIAAGLIACSWGGPMGDSLGSLVIIATVLTCSPVSRSLSGRLGAVLGRYSFPIYLVHPMVICSASSFVYVALMSSDTPKVLILAITALVTAVATILCSMPFAWLESWWVPTLNRQAKRLLQRFGT